MAANIDNRAMLPTGLMGAAEFVNIGRNMVAASKSEGWCALSPIAGTGSREEYIMITQEYKGRRELTQLLKGVLVLVLVN